MVSSSECVNSDRFACIHIISVSSRRKTTMLKHKFELVYSQKKTIILRRAEAFSFGRRVGDNEGGLCASRRIYALIEGCVPSDGLDIY